MEFVILYLLNPMGIFFKIQHVRRLANIPESDIAVSSSGAERIRLVRVNVEICNLSRVGFWNNIHYIFARVSKVKAYNILILVTYD